MSERLEEFGTEDALDAAVRVLSAVKNADAYDELAAAIALRFAQRSDFNRAVEIADTINDPFAMEKSIAEIAVRLASVGRDADAFELVDSIEEHSHQAIARSQIAIAHATAGEFDRALEIANELDDNSSTLVDIAYQFAEKDQPDRALEVINLMDFPLGAVSVRSRVAGDYFKAGRTAEAIELLDRALDESEEIDPPNERAGALSDLAVRYSEIGQDDKSIEILSLALEITTESDESFQDAAFSQIAAAYARLGQYDVAVSITEKIESVYLAVSTLIDLAVIENEKDERHADAILLLSDAYDLIVEDEPRTQNDDAQHNYLLSRIAVTFAVFREDDRALKTALIIRDVNTKNRAVAELGLRFAQLERFEVALSTVRAIEEESYRTAVLIRLARTMIAAGANEQGMELIAEAKGLSEGLDDPFDQVQSTSNLSIAYSEADDKDQIQPLIARALESASSITDAASKATGLLSIADACWVAEYDLDDNERELLWEISVV